MSESQSAVDESDQWEYKCPQFCDLTATETDDQLRQIDNFFEVDHESKSIDPFDELMPAPQQTPVLSQKIVTNGLPCDLEDGFSYETPPQNKENIEEDNEVFYSSKKYLSVEKSYKLRSTPMRALQYNGNTPLRETRMSSKKKKKNKSKLDSLSIQKEETLSESVFDVNQLVQSLCIPITSAASQANESEAQNVINVESIDNTIENGIKGEEQSKSTSDEVFEKEIALESSNCAEVVDRRVSYVIENRPHKSVTLVSPPKPTQTNSNQKPSTQTSRRKATPKPMRRSVTKVNTASVVARLYSTTKKANNPYKSLAELLKEFESGPRGADRSRSLDRTGSAQRSRSSSVSSLTRPQSPKLHSVHRHRPTPRQTEDIIASQIKKYSFKANPIRKKLFDSKFASGIPRVKSTKVPTKAVEMNFLTEKRHEERAAKHSSDEQSAKDETRFRFKANPMPAFKVPQQMARHSDKKATTFRPFSFDDRIRDLVTKKRSLSESSKPMTKSVSHE